MNSTDENIDDLLGLDTPKLKVVKPRKRHKKISLNRTLKRKANFRASEDSDMRRFYAGYKMGAFPMIKADLKPLEFVNELGRVLIGMPNMSPLTMFNDEGTVIGLCVVTYSPDGVRIEPHATWMPWAEKSAILTVLVKFYHTFSQEFTVILPVDQSTRKCYDHIKRYGIMRYVGMVRNFFGEGKDGFFYQGVKV